MSTQVLPTPSHTAGGDDDALAPWLAWAVSGAAGVPALAIAAWGLAGGYSFSSLPFSLVIPVALLAIGPWSAFLLTIVHGPVRVIRIPLAIALSGGSALVSGLAAVTLVFVLPLSLLDDSGRALQNFNSVVLAILIGLIYSGLAIAFTISLFSWVRRRVVGQTRRSLMRYLALVAMGSAGLLVLSALVGTARGAWPDKQGIPLGPVSASWFATRPESSLVYPGSDVVSRRASGEHRELTVSEPATAATVFYTRDDPTRVAAWYAQQLATQAWRTSTDFGYSREEQHWAFIRGTRERFRLSLYQSDAGFPDQATHPGEHRFEVDYLVFQPGKRDN